MYVVVLYMHLDGIGWYWHSRCCIHYLLYGNDVATIIDATSSLRWTICTLACSRIYVLYVCANKLIINVWIWHACSYIEFLLVKSLLNVINDYCMYKWILDSTECNWNA